MRRLLHAVHEFEDWLFNLIIPNRSFTDNLYNICGVLRRYSATKASNYSCRTSSQLIAALACQLIMTSATYVSVTVLQ